ncbi:hypothetical protein GCM10010329_81010 [Streptomyces spiroverticillatus]|uniref:Tetratricopeptide repeat protein n=1 Tax=Streptomyces finlayi TaxID=67296 RepID=A0A919CEU7_9ACTN|nr:Twin-arginine translocation pathway signal [Streptomyces finlayi]GHA46244.1 hypothetical protein GCM10010329_81010 [Streptomyces spiroverticillatus]GHD16406.1 hypothetical protein GCM10010334_77480 [Streptomyces finlayi]
MLTITRSRRAEIVREAAAVRMRCQRHGHSTERTVTAIRTALPEVSALEGWRLALGWSRADTITQVRALYVADGLRPPSLTEAKLCRWEHNPREWPGEEYRVMLCRAYGARPAQLGLPGRDNATGPVRYGRPQTDARAEAYGLVREMVLPMTTDAGLPAVRESLHLALLADPAGSSTVTELAQAAVEHYALNYSTHPPALLFAEARTARGLLTEALVEPSVTEPVATELRRTIGWLSALLGNAAFHLADLTGARAHLAAAVTYGTRTGDARLTTWAYGAQSMVARTLGHYDQALTLAEHALAHAPAGLPRAQAHAWAHLPALAGQGRATDAETALADARRQLDTDPNGFTPGRFGFDAAELALHEAEAHIRLGRTALAITCAETSLTTTTTGTPGWAAASLVLAQAEAPAQPADAAHRALHVLDTVPPARLRSTTRTRLSRLALDLTTTDAAGVADLRDRLRTLPPAIDHHGAATA